LRTAVVDKRRGAFSGKDPTKVDRSAAYAARYLAKNVVAAGLAERCTIQLSYAIGVAKPFSIYTDTFGRSDVHLAKVERAIAEVMNLTPRGIRSHLGLNRPIYARPRSRRRLLMGAHRLGRSAQSGDLTNKGARITSPLFHCKDRAKLLEVRHDPEPAFLGHPFAQFLRPTTWQTLRDSHNRNLLPHQVPDFLQHVVMQQSHQQSIEILSSIKRNANQIKQEK
jgi:hypothetical protein